MSAEQLRRVLKTAQTWFPWSRPVKFGAYNQLTRRFGMHVEAEFRLLRIFTSCDDAQMVDIGGNWGQSIEAMRYFGRPSSIVSFEPNPPLASRLQRIYASDPVVTIHSCGLADADAQARLFTPSYGKFVFDGATSFDHAEASYFLNARRMAWFDQSLLTVDSVDVPVHQLDSFNLKPVAVKIDVQGFEYQVLKGAIETMRAHRPLAIIEAAKAEVVRFFEDLGMRAYGLRGSQLVPDSTRQRNTVFMTPAHVEAAGAYGYSAPH